MVGISLLCTLSVNAQNNRHLHGVIGNWCWTIDQKVLEIKPLDGNYGHIDFYNYKKNNYRPQIPYNILDYIILNNKNINVERTDIEEIVIRGRIEVNYCADLFYGFHNVKKIDLRGLYSPSLANMKAMFTECWKLNEVIMPNLSTDKVVHMELMFCDCKSLESIDISHFNMNEVTHAGGMFAGCSSLKTVKLPKTNTSKLIDLQQMFEDCNSLESINLADFQVKDAWVAYNMFKGCEKLKVIDASRITLNYRLGNANTMFAYCSSATTIKFPCFKDKRITIKGILDGCNSIKHVGMANSAIPISSMLNAIGSIYSATRISTMDLTNCVQDEWVSSPFNPFPSLNQIYSNTNTPNNLPVGFFDKLYSKARCKIVVPQSAYYAHYHSTGWNELSIVTYNNAKSQSLDISFDNDVEATGIIDIEENKAKEDVFYNLRGQRVSNNTNGLIIKNGKKYFVK